VPKNVVTQLEKKQKKTLRNYFADISLVHPLPYFVAYDCNHLKKLAALMNFILQLLINAPPPSFMTMAFAVITS